MAPDLQDPQQFERAYEDHHRSVYAAAMRILADPVRAQDVVQDVYLKLWRKPGAFDPRRADLGTYLRLMARSRALDVYREGQAAGRARGRLELVVSDEEPRVDERPDAAAERDDARALVRDGLRSVPGKQREALVLAYWGGLTANEIAARTNIPLGTAKSRLRLGLQKLREETTAVLSPEPAAAA
jgi:RNA polymerase sigma-70 factor (ECF subfamily)